MAFAVEDYEDLVRLLGERPEWQEQLRRLLLADDFLALPRIVRELAEAQERAEERLAGVEERLEGVEERLERLERTVANLAEAVHRLTAELGDLGLSHRRLATQVGEMRGEMLELRFRDRLPSYFGRQIRRVRTLTFDDIGDELEQALSPEELDEVLCADIIFGGVPRLHPELGRIVLVAEVSAVIDSDDVSRAAERAGLIRRAGFRSLPVVVGKTMTESARLSCDERHVIVAENGRIHSWEDALGNWAGVSGDSTDPAGA